MPSRRHKRLSRNGTYEKRRRAHIELTQEQGGPDVPTVEVLKEPKLLAEDIGKLADLGIPAMTISRLRDGGVRTVRDLELRGKESLRGIFGMKSRLPELEQVLSRHHVTLPA
ncbi:MAG: hypothetical protein ACAH17_01390 [Candidatus Paceibacterota bacterium]